MRRTYHMRLNIEKIAKKHGFDLWAADGSTLVVHNDPYMPLMIVARGTDMVYVNHFRRDDYGDYEWDPEVEFWRGADGEWYPVSIQAAFGYKRHVEFEDGQPARFHPALQADLASFCHTWGMNIKRQGFLDTTNVINSQVNTEDGSPQGEDAKDTEPVIEVTPPPFMPQIGGKDAVEQAVESLMANPPQGGPERPEKPVQPVIDQPYVGRLIGSVNANVHCYGYRTHNGRLIYINMGGAAMAVRALYASLQLGGSIALDTEQNETVIYLEAKGEARLTETQVSQPKYLSMIAVTREMYKPSKTDVYAYIPFVGEDSAKLKMMDHLHRALDMPVFDSWANYLWEAGHRAGLIDDTDGQGLAIKAMLLTEERWKKLITLSLSCRTLTLIYP